LVGPAKNVNHYCGINHDRVSLFIYGVWLKKYNFTGYSEATC